MRELTVTTVNSRVSIAAELYKHQYRHTHYWDRPDASGRSKNEIHHSLIGLTTREEIEAVAPGFISPRCDVCRKSVDVVVSMDDGEYTHDFCPKCLQKMRKMALDALKEDPK